MSCRCGRWEVLCLHYKDGDGDFGLNMKSLFNAEVSFVLNTNNTFPVTFTILFGLFQKAPDAQLKVIMYGPGSGLSLTPGHLLVILSILVQISSRLSSSSSNR